MNESAPKDGLNESAPPVSLYADACHGIHPCIPAEIGCVTCVRIEARQELAAVVDAARAVIKERRRNMAATGCIPLYLEKELIVLTHEIDKFKG